MRLVSIETPYAGNIEENVKYARKCMRDSLLRGEAPYASHLIYTQPGVLDDTIPDERKLGMEAGKEWEVHAELTAVYTDLGVSSGMIWGIEKAEAAGRPVEYRSIR